MVTVKVLLNGLLKILPSVQISQFNKCTRSLGYWASCSSYNSKTTSSQNILECPVRFTHQAPKFYITGNLESVRSISPPSCFKTNLLPLVTDTTLLRQEAVEDNEKKAFDDTFPIIVEHLTKNLESQNLHEVAKWFEEVLNYNVPYGKKNRGMAVVNSFKVIVDDANSQQLHDARIVGWCIEMVQACFLISDDIMDQSLTRRGQACWYKKEGVGMMAINDTIMMSACIHKALFDFVEDKRYSSDLQNCFQDVTWKTSNGQCLDMLSAQKSGRPDLKKYTEDRYASIIKYKTAYYTICLPVHLALILAGMKDRYTSSVEDILLNIGHFFQVQDDYLDCFGDPNITGKVGTDIEDGKCCWPIVMALPRVSDKDRSVLEANYGISNAESVKKIREIYTRIGLQDLYNRYEVDTYKNLCQKIEEVSKVNSIPPAMFYSILNKIYKRIK